MSEDVAHFAPGGDYSFRLLAQALTDYAIYMMDPEGFISTWNAGGARIKGYSDAEIIGQHFSRFFTDEDQRAGLPQRILDIARREGRYESEGWRVRKDGQKIWVVAVIEAIRNDAGNLLGFGKVTRDITDRHVAREALIESERRFRLLVDSVRDYAIYMLDPSGIITRWNTGAARIKGYSAEEVIGTHFSRFYTKEDRSSGIPVTGLETAKRAGKYEAEGWQVRKDGGRFWASIVLEPILENGVLLGYAQITRDITERRSAQEALRESERQFRLLVSAVVDYAIFMLDPNGIVVSWNAGAEKIKQYRANEVIGSHFSRFYPAEDRAAGHPARALHKATSEGRYESEGWRVRKDGTRFWASVVLDAIKDENGDLVGFAKITRDITERREAQLALERAQQQLAQAQKMEALGQLTGGIAHDFNNLLTIIGGQTRILKKLTSDPKGLAAAEAVELTVQRGAALTRQLLGFSRREELHCEHIDTAARLKSLESMLRVTLPPNVDLIFSLDPDTYPIVADPNELDLAIMNLVLNARDAMPGGGRVTILTENITGPDERAPDGARGSFTCIEVLDNGAGIPKELLPRVFEPFFTTKGEGKGTGLGLSQAFGFARQSRGKISLDSQVGKGTRVTICLPRADVERIADKIQPQEDEAEHRHAKILMVEDNAHVTEASSALIKQMGYTVRLAGSAEEALRILESESFDIVFSDIMMPGELDGLALARLLRDERPALSVLLTSGSLKLVEEAREQFITLQKPYSPEDVDRAVQHLLSVREKTSEGANLVDLSKEKIRRRDRRSE